jgi:hypothetical protein
MPLIEANLKTLARKGKDDLRQLKTVDNTQGQ